MRVSLWPGLVHALKRNLSRRQGRVRIFEQGLRFILEDNELNNLIPSAACLRGPLAGAMGHAGGYRGLPRRQGRRRSPAGLTAAGLRFRAAEHPALHPGPVGEHPAGRPPAGWIGALHPRLVRELDLERAPLLWELDEDVSFAAELPVFSEISRFPAIRRDIAVVVEEAFRPEALLECIRAAGGAF
jgi:phenylalanyl-tRNA synthetase beta chain